MRRVLSVTVLFCFFVFVSFVSLQQGGTALCQLLRVKNNKSNPRSNQIKSNHGRLAGIAASRLANKTHLYNLQSAICNVNPQNCNRQ